MFLLMAAKLHLKYTVPWKYAPRKSSHKLNRSWNFSFDAVIHQIHKKNVKLPYLQEV